MPVDSNSAGASVWLANWRFPPPPAHLNSSTLISYVVVAEKTVFPPHDTAAAEVPSENEDSRDKIQSNSVSIPLATNLPLLGITNGPTEIHSIASRLSSQNAFHFKFADTGDTVNVDVSYGIVIFLITLSLISTSLITIHIILTCQVLKDVVGHYLLSLSFIDFLTGLILTPFALYASFDPHSRYRRNLNICKFQAYFGVSLYAVTAYTFLWICVDRYVALKRPTRYQTEQTLTRCKCWIIFTWITAGLLCCPTLFTQTPARYSYETFLCTVDWEKTVPYSLALAGLIFGPTLSIVIVCYWYIIRKWYNPDRLDQEQKIALDTDPSYITSFFIILFHFINWTPWFGLKAYEFFILKHDLTSRSLHFCLFWLAIAGANWKIFICTSLNKEFRKGMRNLFKKFIKCPAIFPKYVLKSRKRKNEAKLAVIF